MSWQSKPSYVVSGHDLQSVEGISLLDCKKLCMANQPQCRSIDYFPGNSKCYLGDIAYGDPGLYSLLHVGNGNYYSFCELGKSLAYLTKSFKSHLGKLSANLLFFFFSWKFFVLMNTSNLNRIPYFVIILVITLYKLYVIKYNMLSHFYILIHNIWYIDISLKIM